MRQDCVKEREEKKGYLGLKFGQFQFWNVPNIVIGPSYIDNVQASLRQFEAF